MNEEQGRGRRKAIHPGSGRRQASAFSRGRSSQAADVRSVRDLLGDRPRRRDLLIEYLHLIQDREGCLSAGHLHALAEELRIPMAEIHEVASFYAHFDIVHDGEERPAPVTVRVCESLPCLLAGAERLLDEIGKDVREARVRVLRAPCMGRCDTAPVCEVGRHHVDHATSAEVLRCIEAGAVRPRIPDYQDLATYRAGGGYDVLADCLSSRRGVDGVISILSDAGLRGLGGAGFPAGRKWSLVRQNPGPRLMAVNGDEGEPGTFKDRYYLERWPHQFLEGALIAAWAVEAETLYIYIRDEYPVALEILRREIAVAQQAGLAPHVEICLRRGAGAYICGEESAMLESIEGKRGLPRQRPPYVAQVGLFGRPTLVNNVETLFWTPLIIEKGADWFATQGRGNSRGFRSYSVSGRVRNPGVKRAPAGLTARELINDYCGGMCDGHVFRAYLPGGASGGILPASMDDISLDFGQLEQFGAFVGSHAVIILSDQDDMKEVALALMKFFRDESCGQCTPCRNGTEKAVELMSRPIRDPVLFNDLLQVMRDASICGLGQAAPNPLACLLKYFPEDVS